MTACQYIAIERRGWRAGDPYLEADKCRKPAEGGPWCPECRTKLLVLTRAAITHEINKLAVTANNVARGMDAKTFIASI